MPIEATEVDGILRVVVTGPWPSIDELDEVRAKAIAAGHLTETTLELLDVRAMRGRLPTIAEGRLLARRFSAPPARRALLVSSDVQYGLGRMAEVLLSAPLRVFRDEAAAIEWLRSPRD